MNSPAIEHSAPGGTLPPHTTPYPWKYPLSNLVTITQHVQGETWKPAPFTHRAVFDICWRALGVSAANSWQVNPFRAPCPTFWSQRLVPIVVDEQFKTLLVETRYFIGEGNPGICMAMSGILQVLFDGTPVHLPSTNTPDEHPPFTGKVDEGPVAGPTYVTSTPFSVPVVALGNPSSSEPQAERKSTKDAIAKKFFMFRALLRHSFPHPERGVKFFFVRTESSEEKKHFFEVKHGWKK